MRNIIIATALIANTALATDEPIVGPIAGPTVECRFAAFEKDGDVGMDESVVFTTTPGGFVEGDFDPYEIKIASGANAFEINVRLDGKLISRLNFPLVQVAALPVGSTVFGISASTHRPVDGFESIQYECKKAL